MPVATAHLLLQDPETGDYVIPRIIYSDAYSSEMVAYADLILVDGNPLEDLDLIADPEANFDLIMKDGKIYKNAL